MRRLVTLTVLAAVAVPAVAAAQEPQPRERERVFSYSFGPEGGGHFSIARRGRLGVTVDMRPDAARDSVGALIAGVTPGGAAERAGIRAGDIVTRFNGAPLAGAAAAGEPVSAEESSPANRLIRYASRLDAGDTVRLEIRRDGRPQTFTFQSEESDMDMLVRRMEPLMRGDLPEMVRNRVMVHIGRSALDDLELVKNNPGLGANFGTAEGLVVTNVGADSSSLGVRAGDVILGIGGRRPSSPAHAMRILATYEPGEAVQFEVMRQRRRMTVSGRMPQPREGEWRIRPNSFEEMLPHGQRVIIKT